MIITCPHCRTKYQVTYEAIGSAGRKVQCAHCHQAWDQQPLPPRKMGSSPAEDPTEADRLFDSMSEDALDEALATEAAAVLMEQPAIPRMPISVAPQPAEAARPRSASDAAEMRKRQAAFSRRQHAIVARLPLARLRRAARVAGVLTLAGILGFGYFGRVAIVDRYPDLAGVYSALGLGVNVVGLDFSNLQTLRSLSGGNDVLLVSAQIVGQSSEPVSVPPVVVSLLDANGRAVYEWSVMPRVRDLMQGERASFDTRLTLPPTEATRVRLSFAGGNWTDSPRSQASGTASGSAQPAQDQHAPALAEPAHH